MNIFTKVLFGLVLFLQGAIQPVAWADENVMPKEYLGRPIDVEMDLFKSIKYSVGDVELRGRKDIEDMIYPLRDEYSTKKLKSSDELNFIGGVFWWGGVAGMVFSVVDASTKTATRTNNFNSFSYDYSSSVAIFGVGVIGMVTGALFRNQSDVDCFDAVQRYNRIVRKEVRLSLDFSPERREFDLGLRCYF